MQFCIRADGFELKGPLQSHAQRRIDFALAHVHPHLTLAVSTQHVRRVIEVVLARLSK